MPATKRTTTMGFSTRVVQNIVCADAPEGYRLVSKELAGRTRWDVQYDVVFEDPDGRFWCVNWSEGATESQDYDMADLVPTLDAIEVHEVEKMVKVWEPVRRPCAQRPGPGGSEAPVGKETQG